MTLKEKHKDEKEAAKMGRESATRMGMERKGGAQNVTAPQTRTRIMPFSAVSASQASLDPGHQQDRHSKVQGQIETSEDAFMANCGELAPGPLGF